MTKKDLVRLIREVVKREVKNQVNILLTEMETKSNKKTTIQEAIDQTAAEDFPTMKTFTAADARSQFAAMQNGYQSPQPQTDLQGKPVDVNSLGGGLDKALTRDYSKLVQRFDK